MSIASDNTPVLLGVFPGARRFPAQAPVESPSRLCEVCWCDNALFPGNIADPIIILDDRIYQFLQQQYHRAIPHGSLGEQFLIKNLREANPVINSQVQIGDAILQVTGIVNFQTVRIGEHLHPDISQQLFGIETTISDEGLIEPGAPIRITSPQPNRER